ncbi:MAG TPA: hypothetical protein VHU40_15040 [Polyangia bacterium]|nr:hypothetical protein [Polyangia bacterium]
MKTTVSPFGQAAGLAHGGLEKLGENSRPFVRQGHGHGDESPLALVGHHQTEASTDEHHAGQVHLQREHAVPAEALAPHDLSDAVADVASTPVAGETASRAVGKPSAPVFETKFATELARLVAASDAPEHAPIAAALDDELGESFEAEGLEEGDDAHRLPEATEAFEPAAPPVVYAMPRSDGHFVAPVAPTAQVIAENAPPVQAVVKPAALSSETAVHDVPARAAAVAVAPARVPGFHHEVAVEIGPSIEPTSARASDQGSPVPADGAPAPLSVTVDEPAAPPEIHQPLFAGAPAVVARAPESSAPVTTSKAKLETPAAPAPSSAPAATPASTSDAPAVLPCTSPAVRAHEVAAPVAATHSAPVHSGRPSKSTAESAAPVLSAPVASARVGEEQPRPQLTTAPRPQVHATPVAVVEVPARVPLAALSTDAGSHRGFALPVPERVPAVVVEGERVVHAHARSEKAAALSTAPVHAGARSEKAAALSTVPVHAGARSEKAAALSTAPVHAGARSEKAAPLSVSSAQVAAPARREVAAPQVPAEVSAPVLTVPAQRAAPTVKPVAAKPAKSDDIAATAPKSSVAPTTSRPEHAERLPPAAKPVVGSAPTEHAASVVAQAPVVKAAPGPSHRNDGIAPAHVDVDGAVKHGGPNVPDVPALVASAPPAPATRATVKPHQTAPSLIAAHGPEDHRVVGLSNSQPAPHRSVVSAPSVSAVAAVTPSVAPVRTDAPASAKLTSQALDLEHASRRPAAVSAPAPRKPGRATRRVPASAPQARAAARTVGTTVTTPAETLPFSAPKRAQPVSSPQPVQSSATPVQPSRAVDTAVASPAPTSSVSPPGRFKLPALIPVDDGLRRASLPSSPSLSSSLSPSLSRGSASPATHPTSPVDTNTLPPAATAAVSSPAPESRRVRAAVLDLVQRSGSEGSVATTASRKGFDTRPTADKEESTSVRRPGRTNEPAAVSVPVSPPRISPTAFVTIAPAADATPAPQRRTVRDEHAPLAPRRAPAAPLVATAAHTVLPTVAAALAPTAPVRASKVAHESGGSRGAQPIKTAGGSLSTPAPVAPESSERPRTDGNAAPVPAPAREVAPARSAPAPAPHAPADAVSHDIRGAELSLPASANAPRALLDHAAADPSLHAAAIGNNAHLRLETANAGSLSLHLHVRDGVADVEVEGAGARSLDLRPQEIRRALEHRLQSFFCTVEMAVLNIHLGRHGEREEIARTTGQGLVEQRARARLIPVPGCDGRIVKIAHGEASADTCKLGFLSPA